MQGKDPELVGDFYFECFRDEAVGKVLYSFDDVTFWPCVIEVFKVVKDSGWW